MCVFHKMNCSPITLSCIIICVVYGRSAAQKPTDLRSAIGSQGYSADTMDPDRSSIIFMLRFIDFGCQPCLQNIFEICDSIADAGEKPETIPVYLLFLSDQTSPGFQLTAMTEWAKSAGLPYPVALVSSGVFQRYGVEHSSVLIMGKNDSLEYRSEIPLSKTLLGKLLRKIRR